MYQRGPLGYGSLAPTRSFLWGNFCVPTPHLLSLGQRTGGLHIHLVFLIPFPFRFREFSFA